MIEINRLYCSRRCLAHIEVLVEGETVWLTFVEEYRLRNLEEIIINAVVCILYEMQLFSKQLNAVPEFGYSRNDLVQNCVRHIFWW